jgi:hypothetical protein
MSTEVEQALLKFKQRAVYNCSPLTTSEWRVVRSRMTRGPLAIRILANLIAAVAGRTNLKHEALRQLSRSAVATRKANIWAMRYMGEAVMLMSGKRILKDTFLRFAIRALKSEDRDSKINAASALIIYARKRHPLAVVTLQHFAEDPDPAVRGNALAGLGSP